MKRIVASIVLFSMCAAGAAVIDGSYRIVLPKKKPLGVQNAIEEAGRELAAALKEGAGLDVEVVWSNEFKGRMRKNPAIFLGAGPAEKAGVILFFRRSTCRLPRSCKRSCINIPHKNRTQTDRYSRRSKNARRSRSMRTSFLLFKFPLGFCSGFNKNGKRTKPVS